MLAEIISLPWPSGIMVLAIVAAIIAFVYSVKLKK
jgi:hypothetical protein